MDDPLASALKKWRPLFRSRAFGIHEPEDVENETALRVLIQQRDGKRFHNLRGIVGFLGFQTLSQLHKKRIAVVAEADLEPEQTTYDRSDGGRAEPHEVCGREEAVQRVRDAIGRVDPKTRSVIFACYWEGRPMARTDPCFAQQVQRAREKLREAMVAP